ncbi:MAG: HAMP domain-containing sensor histidine kinase [Arthrobacter sp.]
MSVRTWRFPPSLDFHRRFGMLSPRLQILCAQLPLVVTLGGIALAWTALFPQLFTSPGILTGLSVIAAATAVAGLLPWGRLPAWCTWSVPLLDLLGIGFLYSGGQGLITGVSLVQLFPVAWMAWSRVAPRAAVVITVLSALLIVWSPVFTSHGPVERESLAAPILVPPILGVVSYVCGALRLELDTWRESLRTKDAELEAALEESKHRAQLLDGVLNAIGVGVLVVDARGRDVHRNTAQIILDDAGIRARDQAGGVLQVFEADGVTPLPPEQRPVPRALRGSFEDLQLWAGGPENRMALSVSARTLRDDDGRVTGSVIASTDITAMVRALRTKDDFVSSVSHELRTPLTSILGYLEMAQDSLQDPFVPAERIAAQLEVAQRNGDRLLQLVSDLLATAGGSGTITPVRQPLAELVADRLQAAGPRARAGKVQLVSEVPPELCVYADPNRLCQVLDNLLSNAVKYTPDGGTVTVRAGTSGDRTLFSVADTGMGMSEEEQSGLFTRFFRTEAVRRAGIPGAGLGMAISKGIVEAHGGQITVQSAPGEGTVFTVSLPSAPDAAASEEPGHARAGA